MVEKELKRLFEELFEEQIQRLDRRGCPPTIITMLVAQKELVLQRAKNFFQEGNIPFLPVIPRGCGKLNLEDLMMMTEGEGGKRGYSLLFESEIIIIDIDIGGGKSLPPYSPYYIFNVEWNSIFFGKKSEEDIVGQTRLFLTTEEIIALCCHMEPFLLNYYLCALGSRVQHVQRRSATEKMPIIYKDVVGGRPCLSQTLIDRFFPYGARFPSCSWRGI